jgi:hypothetical protein
MLSLKYELGIQSHIEVFPTYSIDINLRRRNNLPIYAAIRRTAQTNLR